MVEHLTQRQFEDYNRQRLGVSELLSVSDHLAECETCRRRLEATLNGDAAFFGLRAEIFDEAAVLASQQARAHVTAELAAGYVDGNLPGEQIQTITEHLAVCDECALAVDDLAVFRDQIAASLDDEYRPAPVAAPADGWWRRAVAYLIAPFKQSAGLAFAAVAAVLLLAVTGLVPSRATPPLAEPEPEIAVITDPPPQRAPAPRARVVARLNDGEGRLTLEEGGKLSGADGLPIAYQSMMQEALSTRRVERSAQLNGLTRQGSSLMGADKQRDDFSVIEPVGKVLISDRPTLRWSPMDGATGYVVEIYDSKFNLAAASPHLYNHSWVAPALSRGQVYSWQVKAIKDGQEFASPRPPAPQARFRILDRAKAGELAKAKRAYSSSHLALGLLYAEAGLLGEAERELRLLQKANPGSEIARALLSRVQALRR